MITIGQLLIFISLICVVLSAVFIISAFIGRMKNRKARVITAYVVLVLIAIPVVTFVKSFFDTLSI